MTKDEAVEKCTKAMLRLRNIREENWNIQPKDKELATNIVAALEALELWKPN
jgi:hypothetical protein